MPSTYMYSVPSVATSLPVIVVKSVCVKFSILKCPTSTDFSSVAILKQSLARFIWNAEISISVAIHCYERLF